MKIAVIGQIHEDGLKVLDEAKFEFLQINDFDENNLKKKLNDILKAYEDKKE